MSAHEPSKATVALSGVSETALLTLNSRAKEARRPDPLINDPMAIALVDSIQFDFAKFGRPRQDIALRALGYDAQARSYLDQHPTATVVALAEGLQTSFWRLDAAIPDSQFRWLTVDLPEIVDVRTWLLPASSRVSTCAQSALDYSWMESVDPAGGVFITAEGLLMYLLPEQALGPDRSVRQEISRRSDALRSAPGLVRQGEPLRSTNLAALQGPTDPVQPQAGG